MFIKPATQMSKMSIVVPTRVLLVTFYKFHLKSFKFTLNLEASSTAVYAVRALTMRITY